MNQKGGVGKTTTTANLGAALAASGKATCLVDLDPQCHLSLHFGVEAPPTTFDLLLEQITLDRLARKVNDRLLIAPASVDLAAIDLELADAPGREQRLRRQLTEHAPPVDVVLIDCPPSLGLLTLNALSAADEVLIPLQPHFLALQGLGRLLETVALVQQRINPSLTVKGVVLCMFERITRLANEVVVDLHQFFDAARGQTVPWADASVFETVIRRNVKLAECPSHGMSIFDYDPTCNGAKDYAELADEFLGLNAPPALAGPAAALDFPEGAEPAIDLDPAPAPGPAPTPPDARSDPFPTSRTNEPPST